MLNFLSSARITVLCLFWLFVLTFWGTIAQVQQGLYATQDRFFNSFFFLAAGFIPVPGAQLVLWVFFVNLMAMMALTFKKYARWENAGLLITHLGLVLYFVAAFMIFHFAQESNIRLVQDEATNVAVSYQDWELAYWKQDALERQVTAIEAKPFKAGYQIPFHNKDFVLSMRAFYTNCDAFRDATVAQDPAVQNPLGITLLSSKSKVKENEQNTAGAVVEAFFDNSVHLVYLYGAQNEPTVVSIKGQPYAFILRHKHYPLPFTIQLNHFKAEFHRGTEMAKSYESLVTLTTAGLKRQVRIYMNNPLRYKDYTIYQSGYDTDATGRQATILAVVKNGARVLPYLACFVVFLGLALHFLIQAFRAKVRA